MNQSKEQPIPIPIKNKIVGEANWRSTNGHGGVDDITRDNFILAAEYGYSLSSEQLEAKDKEIERLKGLIEWLWLQHNPHSNFFGHTDGEKIKQQKRFLQKFITENNIEDAAIYTGNSLK